MAGCAYLYANNAPLYRHLRIRGFWYLLRSWNECPGDTQGQVCKRLFADLAGAFQEVVRA